MLHTALLHGMSHHPQANPYLQGPYDPIMPPVFEVNGYTLNPAMAPQHGSFPQNISPLGSDEEHGGSPPLMAAGEVRISPQRSRPRRKRSRPSTTAKREKRETKRTVYLSPLPSGSTEDSVRELLKEFGELQLVEWVSPPDEEEAYLHEARDPAAPVEAPKACYARFECAPQAVKAREAGETNGVNIIYKQEHIDGQVQSNLDSQKSPSQDVRKAPLNGQKKGKGKHKKNRSDGESFKSQRRNSERQRDNTKRRSVCAADLEKASWRRPSVDSGRTQSSTLNAPSHRRSSSGGSNSGDSSSTSTDPQRSRRPRSVSDASLFSLDPRFAKSTGMKQRRRLSLNRPSLTNSAKHRQSLGLMSGQVAKGPEGQGKGFNWKFNPKMQAPKTAETA